MRSTLQQLSQTISKLSVNIKKANVCGPIDIHPDSIELNRVCDVSHYHHNNNSNSEHIICAF